MGKASKVIWEPNWVSALLSQRRRKSALRSRPSVARRFRVVRSVLMICSLWLA